MPTRTPSRAPNALETAITILEPAIAAAADRAMENADIRDKDEVKADVVKEVAAVVVNQTNQEPWYQSRVTWGAVIAVAGGVAGIAGYSIDAQDQAQIVNGTVGVVTAIGGLVAWYGRWIAKKPLGQ